MSSPRLLRSLKLVDLAMQQNRHHIKHAKYRGSPLISYIDKLLKTELVESNTIANAFAPFLSKSTQSGSRYSRTLTNDDGSNVASPAKGAGSRLSVVPQTPTADEENPVTAEPTESATNPEIIKLWSHSCPETAGREVTALAWSTPQVDGRGSNMKASFSQVCPVYG